MSAKNGDPGHLEAVKPHIPLIKFRKGGLVELVRGVPQSSSGSPSPRGEAAAASSEQPLVLEEWQLPHKYRRERITQEEIDYINRGGPA